MLLQQPIHNDFNQVQQQQQQQGPGRPAQQNQNQSSVIRQLSGQPKPAACGAHSSSPLSLRENTSPSAQVEYRLQIWNEIIFNAKV